ncbi:MAG: DUF4148 domain-containing protein [Massilia sp.]
MIATLILSSIASYASAGNLDVVNDIGKRPVVVINGPQGSQLTREQVKAQFLEAQKNGDLIVGENRETARELDPRLYPARADTTPKKTREQVRAELSAAQQAGDLVIGENGETARELNPHAYPARPSAVEQAAPDTKKAHRQVRAADRSYYGT